MNGEDAKASRGGKTNVPKTLGKASLLTLAMDEEGHDTLKERCVHLDETVHRLGQGDQVQEEEQVHPLKNNHLLGDSLKSGQPPQNLDVHARRYQVIHPQGDRALLGQGLLLQGGHRRQGQGRLHHNLDRVIVGLHLLDTGLRLQVLVIGERLQDRVILQIVEMMMLKNYVFERNYWK
jgi:hypothetical protein